MPPPGLPPGFPTATAITASLIAVLYLALTVYVGAGRMKFGTGLGDGGHEGLNRRIRMHANLAENAPLLLILLGMTEMTGAYPLMVRIVGAVFVLCRCSHAYGLSMAFGPGRNPFRAIGAGGTFLCMIVLLVALLAAAV